MVVPTSYPSAREADVPRLYWPATLVERVKSRCSKRLFPKKEWRVIEEDTRANIWPPHAHVQSPSPTTHIHPKRWARLKE